jgi:predicted transcriptional regulator
MSVVPLYKMCKAREMITAGMSVKETALKLKVSESWVRSYTKSQRARA